MSALAEHAERYLRLRQTLGHQLDDAHRLLPRFVSYLEEIDASAITVEAALAWVRRPDVDPASSVWSRRMTVVRGFARHMAGIDPATEIPPLGLVTFHQHWKPPFIYSTTDVEALMTAVPAVVPTPLRTATVQTVIGLLAATGMRIGEAIALERGDIDWTEGVLVVRSSKFTKSRELPLQPSTITAMGGYTQTRDQHVPAPASPRFFVSGKGTPICYPDFWATFRELLTRTGIGAGSPARPRIHDLRHSFAVHTLVRWYQAGEDVAALLPRLSTYLGHLTPAYTYWYLSAAPELLTLAADRLENTERRRAR
jgi:integrase